MHKNLLWKKGLVIGIIFLFIGVCLSSIISAENISPIKKEVRNDKNSILFNQEGIFDIIFFRVKGRILYPLWSILNGLKPQLDISVIFWNFNQHSVFVDYHLKIIGTRGNIVLLDMNFTNDEIHPNNGFTWSIGGFYAYDYTYGPFDVILEVYNQNANRDRKVIYHGFVFGIGTIIFNPWGKVI